MARGAYIGMDCLPGYTFCYNLKENHRNTGFPKVEVVLYAANDLYDDRYKNLEGGDSTLAHANTAVFSLALAPEWKNNDTDADEQRNESLYIKHVFLKPGSYVYMYRINGAFHLNDKDEVTILGSKRKVHYVEIGNDSQDQSLMEDFMELEEKSIRPKQSVMRANSSSPSNALSVETLRGFNSLRDLYDLKMAMNAGRLAPFERAVWNRILKKMAVTLSQQS